MQSISRQLFIQEKAKISSTRQGGLSGVNGTWLADMEVSYRVLRSYLLSSR